MMAIDLRNKLINIINSADVNYLMKIESLISPGYDGEISDEHKKILDERLAEHKANPTAGRPWNVVQKELVAKYDL